MIDMGHDFYQCHASILPCLMHQGMCDPFGKVWGVLPSLRGTINDVMIKESLVEGVN